MVRIAVLLTGLVRNYETNYKNLFDKFIDPVRLQGDIVDIFICTWDIRGLYKTFKKYNGGDKTTKSDYLSHDKFDQSNLIKIYNPKKSLILDQNNFRSSIWDKVVNFANKYETTDYNRIFGCLYSQFYTVKKAFDIMEEYEEQIGIKYDIAIRQRFDMLYNKQLTLDDMNIKNNVINVINPVYPIGYRIHNFSGRKCENIVKIGYPDSYALGYRNVIKKYCSFFDVLDKIKNEDLSVRKYGKEIIFPETLLTFSMRKFYGINFNIMENITASLSR